jgi:NCAIR mutase (PurE)-related protein
VRDILQDVRDGTISVEEAEGLLRLNAMAETATASLDLQREARVGIPEIVYGQGKTPAQVVDIVSRFLERQDQAIVTRASIETVEAVEEAFAGDCDLTTDRASGIIVARRRGTRPVSSGRKIGVMTAGTTDISVAEEARTVAEAMGCQVITVYDVGIAGFHRHIEPLREMLAEGVDAIVVVAGMEGALPSVIASLANVPVIGVPTSTGYGFGGQGVGALTTMLQSCSPGLTVVNIDNGVGAGAYAALIARRVSAAIAAAIAEGA